MYRLWLQLAAAAVFLVAWTQFTVLEPRHESSTFSIDPPTPYTHYMPSNTVRGRILVVHGLDVSGQTMSFISAALADGGFEVYAIDLPGHGDSSAKFETGFAEQAIRATMASLGEDTIVLGHSLGAGLLLDLAASRHFSTMVLLAPPPVAIDEIQADHVLIATGAIDLPRILSFVPIAADIGGPQVNTWILPWAAHSTPIFNPTYVRRIVDWLGGDGAKTRTLARMTWLVVMFISATFFGVALLNPQRHPSSYKESDRIPIVLVRYVVACSAAVLVLKFVNPLNWLRLFATDYLIAFVFIAGIVLTGPALYERRGAVREALRARSVSAIARNLKRCEQAQEIDRPYNFNRNALLKAIAAAAYVIGVLGFIVGSHLIHISLTNDRWWRFLCIVPAGFPLFISDELIIRRLHPRWKATTIAFTTRFLLLAFLMVGVLILNRENAFLVLLAPVITTFWIGLWFAAGVVRRSTQDPLSTALFSALVQGWAFAALFVTI
jgi:pimeloyl-ACP methyl ester carboxylesterase